MSTATRRRPIPITTRRSIPCLSGTKTLSLNARYETDLGLSLYSSTRFYYGQYTYDAFREFADDRDGEIRAARRFDGKWWGLDQKFVGNWFKDHALVSVSSIATIIAKVSTGAICRRPMRRYALSRKTMRVAPSASTWPTKYAFPIAGRLISASAMTMPETSPRTGVTVWLPSTGRLSGRRGRSRIAKPSVCRMPMIAPPTGAMAVPEYVAATELVLQHEFSPRMRYTGSLYRYKRSRQLAYSPVADDYVPEGSGTNRGLEVELERSAGERYPGTWQHMAWQHASNVPGAQRIRRMCLAN